MTTILTEQDRQIARERAQKMKDEGTTMRERLDKVKKHITSTIMTIDLRNYHINETILGIGLNKLQEDEDKVLETRRKKELDYKIISYKADLAKKRNPTDDVNKWKNKDDVKAYLAPLKDEIKENWPTNRAGMNQFYMKCWGRGRINLVLEEVVMAEWEKWLENEEKRQIANEEKTKNKGRTK